jgi:shikimate kinase
MKGDNIILVGFMGTGKTIVGKALAGKTGFKFIDTDLMIEAEAKKNIPDIFTRDGEAAFRQYETEAIKRIIHLRNYVIATGGGAVMMDENIANMKRAGMVVCLTATPDVILERTQSDDYRPLLKTKEPLKKILSLLNIREPQYQKMPLRKPSSLYGLIRNNASRVFIYPLSYHLELESRGVSQDAVFPLAHF